MGGRASGHVWGGQADGSCATSPWPRTTASGTCAQPAPAHSPSGPQTQPQGQVGTRHGPAPHTTPAPLRPRCFSPPLLGRLNFGARHPRTPPPLTHFTPWGAAAPRAPRLGKDAHGSTTLALPQNPHQGRLGSTPRTPPAFFSPPRRCNPTGPCHSPTALTEPRRQATSTLHSWDRAPPTPSCHEEKPPKRCPALPGRPCEAPAPSAGGQEAGTKLCARPAGPLLLCFCCHPPARPRPPPTPAPRSGHGSCRPSPRHPAPAPVSPARPWGCPAWCGARLAGDMVAAACGPGSCHTVPQHT